MSQLKNDIRRRKIERISQDAIGVYRFGRIFFLADQKKWHQFKEEFTQFIQLCLGVDEIEYSSKKLVQFLKRNSHFLIDINFTIETMFRFGAFSEGFVAEIFSDSLLIEKENAVPILVGSYEVKIENQEVYLALLEVYSRWWKQLKVRQPMLWNQKSCLFTETTRQGRNVVLWPIRIFFNNDSLRMVMMEHVLGCQKCSNLWTDWKNFYFEYLKQSEKKLLNQLLETTASREEERGQILLDVVLQQEWDQYKKTKLNSLQQVYGETWLKAKVREFLTKDL